MNLHLFVVFISDREIVHVENYSENGEVERSPEGSIRVVNLSSKTLPNPKLEYLFFSIILKGSIPSFIEYTPL